MRNLADVTVRTPAQCLHSKSMASLPPPPGTLAPDRVGGGAGQGGRGRWSRELLKLLLHWTSAQSAPGEVRIERSPWPGAHVCNLAFLRTGSETCGFPDEATLPSSV